MQDIIKGKDSFTVLIPDGDSFFALPVLQCLGRMKNVTVYVLSNSPWTSIRFSRYTKQLFLCPMEDGDQGRLNALLRIVKERKIDVVLTIDEPTIRYLAENGGELRKYTAIAPLPKVETFDIVSNKWLFSQWLIKNMIQIPTTVLYQSDESIEKNLSILTFPVLIKPIKGNGGIGIKFFDDPVSLREYCKSHIRPDEYIIQSFIHGYDVGCSVLCIDGKILACTMQQRAVNLPMTFSPFTNIDFLFDSRIYEIAEKIMDKLNWSGVAHIDLRYDEKENNYTILEMNPRFWQSVVGSFYAGVNFPYLSSVAALKRDLPEVFFKHIHYVNPNTAIKIRLQSIFIRKSELQPFDGSKLEMHLKDPVPQIFTVCQNIYKRRIKPIFKKHVERNP